MGQILFYELPGISPKLFIAIIHFTQKQSEHKKNEEKQAQRSVM